MTHASRRLAGILLIVLPSVMVVLAVGVLTLGAGLVRRRPDHPGKP